MIIGNIRNWERDRPNAHPAVRELIDYLRACPFSERDDGRFDIRGEDAYCTVMTIDLRELKEAKAEKHEAFADIHYLIEGAEKIGWAADTGTAEKTEAYPDKDLSLYEKPEGEQFFTLRPGMYAVLFPSDIHRPGLRSDASQGTVQARKAVVKFRVGPDGPM